jgi:hypothetical protein
LVMNRRFKMVLSYFGQRKLRDMAQIDVDTLVFSFVGDLMDIYYSYKRNT